MAAHMGYVLSGQMTVRMDDGEEATFDRATACVARQVTMPGSSERPMRVLDWQGFADYAKG